MKLSIKKEKITSVLQSVVGVVEKKHTAPILANLRMQADNNGLVVTTTDNEVELTIRAGDVEVSSGGILTTPARKFLELCRSLPDGSLIKLALQENRLLFESGSFQSHLSTLPAGDFPLVQQQDARLSFEMPAAELKNMLVKTSFAMAQQDVRYFFNGTLFDFTDKQLRLVATNGQRLATTLSETQAEGAGQFIVPRKGINEIARIIGSADGNLSIVFSQNHISMDTGSSTIISKLIDGAFPDYKAAIPKTGDKIMTGDRQKLRDALIRASILTNEMYRNVKLHLEKGRISVFANNPMQEDAREELAVEYDGQDLEIGFNVSYLIDTLSVMEGDQTRLTFIDGSSAVLIEDPEDEKTTFVISPMVI